jgi:hypothetical protein
MPGKKESGFVYSNLDPGIKYVNVTLYGLNRLERFIFYFEVPGVQTDYKTVDFDSLYSEDEIVDYQDEGELRAALENLPCCTTNKDGSGRAGDPLNFVFIGDAEDILSALIRRRWDVTEPKPESFNIDVQKIFSTARYRTFPMSNLYLYGRRQDAGFQKSRQKEGETFRQRNQIRFWLTPLRFKGDAIWVGSVTRDMGSDLRKRRFWFAPQEIDPETDDTRDYLVEDLVFSQGVSELGYVKGVGAAGPESPHTNLMNQPWWTDGYRAVFLFGDSLKTLEDLEYFPWEFIENEYLEE